MTLSILLYRELHEQALACAGSWHRPHSIIRTRGFRHYDGSYIPMFWFLLPERAERVPAGHSPLFYDCEAL